MDVSMGRTGSMDAKTFILGQGNVMGKEHIQEFFNCVGNLSFDDAPILRTTRSYADAISALVLKLETKFIRMHPTLQRLFFELPAIKNPKAKKLATLVLMNEFDYIIWEAREIFDFYVMNREKHVIDEIIYNSDYALRHLLGDNKIFDENLKKEVPVLDIIQQVFNNVNQHHSWIVAGNQKGYDENQLRNAKVSMDNMFYVVFTKPHEENTSKKVKNKDDKT